MRKKQQGSFVRSLVGGGWEEYGRMEETDSIEHGGVMPTDCGARLGSKAAQIH